MEEELITELIKERNRFENRGLDTSDHDLTIIYLKHGIKPDDYHKWEILTVAIEDLDMLKHDYLF